MARNLQIGIYDWVREAGTVLTGGSWTPPGSGASLLNLLDHNPQFAAESVDTATASTQFTVDLGQVRVTDVFFLAGISITTYAATIRLRAYSDFLVTQVYDSGTTTIWPYEPTEWQVLGNTKFFVPSASLNVRSFKVEIDSSAVGGSVKVGVCGACQTYEATHPFSLGHNWSIAYVDDSEIVRVPGGSVFITQRPIRRRLDFGLNAITAAEVARVRTLLSLKARSKPVIVVPFSDGFIETTAIYGLFSGEPAISNPFYGHYESVFSVDQFI